jgi:hypothetical protein
MKRNQGVIDHGQSSAKQRDISHWLEGRQSANDERLTGLTRTRKTMAPVTSLTSLTSN